jgi:hypothetical protein
MQQQNFPQQQEQKHTHKTLTSLLKTHMVWMMDEIHPCVAISDWSTSCVLFFFFFFFLFFFFVGTSHLDLLIHHLCSFFLILIILILIITLLSCFG